MSGLIELLTHLLGRVVSKQTNSNKQTKHTYKWTNKHTLKLDELQNITVLYYFLFGTKENTPI